MKNKLARVKPQVYTLIQTPVGQLRVVASDRAIHEVHWHHKGAVVHLKRDDRHPLLKRAVAQLGEYFSGRRRKFNLPLVLEGTDFQKRAWRELAKIPYGRAISYKDQAQALGDPKKARAVGTANSRNPIAIIVPCHRVIAQSGKLAGFGGGIKNKQFLLNLEGARNAS